MLTRSDLLGPVAAPFTPGLVVVDWRDQGAAGPLAELLALTNIAPLPIEVSELLSEGVVRDRQINDATYAIEIALQIGLTPVVYTDFDTGENAVSAMPDRTVSEGLAAIIRRLRRRPAFMVVAGGVTAIGIARMLGFGSEAPFGEIRPGIPVLRLNPKGQFPSLPFVPLQEKKAEISSISGIVRELRER